VSKIVSGIIRVGGRLEKLNAPFTTKKQMIIPKKSTMARMIATGTHRSAGHKGKNSTEIAYLKMRYM
jgi:hypothetical protein